MSNVNGVEMQPAGDASRKASTSESEHDTEAAHSGTGTGGELKPLVEDDIDSPLGGRNSVFRGMTRVHCCALICCLLVLFGVLAGVGIFLLGHWNASVSNLTEAQESSSAGKGSGASVELAPPVGLEDVNLVVAKLVEDLTQGPGKGAAWAMTAEFVDTFGHRQAGSENLERSIDWLAAFCRDAGFDRVYHENVSIPKWTRGQESATLVSPLIGGAPKKLNMLGLGFSPGTPDGGIEAQVLVVTSWADLVEKAALVTGKIVVYNQQWEGYNKTVVYRTYGAHIASRLGAVAVLVRSLTPFSLATPHTGSQSRPASIAPDWLSARNMPASFAGDYSGVARIPAASITVEDVALLSRIQARGKDVRVRIEMGAFNHPGMVISRNTIAEIQGSVKPDEVVIMGGHMDSWDVGQGATDDAGPSLVCLQALLAMLRLGLRPLRTIRMVFFTAEEIGLYGGAQHYANQVASAAGVEAIHLVAELDHGIFNPLGISLQADFTTQMVARFTASLLGTSTGATRVVSRFTEQSDLNDFKNHNVPFMTLLQGPNNVFRSKVETEFQGDYFLYHHTHADTVDRLIPSQMDKAAATMAAHLYAFASMPERSSHTAPMIYDAADAECTLPTMATCA